MQRNPVPPSSPSNPVDAAQAAGFLQPGGRIGALIAARDWSATSLGALDTWPGAVKSLLASWLDSPQAMFVAWGEDLRFFFNEAYLPFLGARGAAVIGQPFAEVWPEIWADIEPIVRQALAGQGARFEEMPLEMQRNGYAEPTWWTFTYMPLRDEHGRVIGMMCTTADATGAVQAARRAEKYRLLQDSMLQQMPGFVALLTGPAHVYEYVNDAYRVIAGERDFLGRTVREVFPELASQGFYELLDTVYRSGEPFVAHAMPLRLAGEDRDRYIDLLYYPVRSTGDQVTGIFVGGYDITPRVNAELALKGLNETLEQRVDERTAELMQTQAALRQAQKLEAIGQLTGGVAHDFNNLLTVIGNSAELLRRPGLPDERRRKCVETIADTVRRAGKLTGQLLAFARRQPLKPEVFDVVDQVATIAELIRPLMGPGIAVRIPPPGAGLFGECDVNQFEIALVNLAANARDAMAAGGSFTIEVAAADGIPPGNGQPLRPGAFVAVSARDTGDGIPPAQLDLVFDPFFTTKELGKGTGLGLSQVLGFITQSGGDVRLESTPGHGSTFVLYLPRAAARPAAAAPADADEAGVDPAHLTVLVVEDNLAVGQICTDILHDLGHTAEWVTDAAAALARLGRGEPRFDLVLSDVMMPGMNGLEMAQIIEQTHPGLPVLLTSGYSDVFATDGTAGRVLIHKPYSVETLRHALRRALPQGASVRRPD